MATPPPYTDITGITRAVMKDNAQVSIVDYDGNARPGELVVAQGTTNLSGSFTGSLLGTAATASYADNFTVGGTLTAQTINVQIITSSIEFVTGSTRNGSLSSNTHQFTGSVLMSGSVGIGTSSPLFTAYSQLTVLIFLVVSQL